MTKQEEKRMAERLLAAPEEKLNRNIKDSVFCDLFSRPEYLLQLYQALHPEDTEIGMEDITLVTLSRVVAKAMYNDLGFLAGNRLMILVEAQSTWSENILVRFLIYLGETYHRYVEQNGLNLYSSAKVSLPIPELYVIFTGERKDMPETISLRHSFFGDEAGSVEVKARVIYGSQSGDIINQYITFAKVFDRQRRLYLGDVQRAIRETIRICKEQDVLKAYLEQEEAAAVMFTLADQDKAQELMVKEERKAAWEGGKAEGRAEGRAEGKAEGRVEGAILEAIRLYHDELELPVSAITPKVKARFGISMEDVEKYMAEALGTGVR